MSGPYVQCAVGGYHDSGGRTVTIVCCPHMAPARYYAWIRTLVTILETAGSVIHCEGAALLPTPAPNQDERRVLDKLHQYLNLERQLLIRRGWVSRYDGLKPGQRWQIKDLDLLDVIRRAGVPASEQHADRWTAAYTAALHSREDAAALWQMEDDFLRAACVEQTRQHQGGIHDVLVAQRAEAALVEVRGTERNLVLVWGPAHMPHLHAGLGADGFILTGEPGWLTVAKLDASATVTPASAFPPWPGREQVRRARPDTLTTVVTPSPVSSGNRISEAVR